MEIMLDIIVYGLCMHGGGVSDSNGSSDPKAYDLLLGWGCKVPIRCFAKNLKCFYILLILMVQRKHKRMMHK